MPPGAAKGTLPFDVTVSDPLKRIQLYIETYKDDPQYAVRLLNVGVICNVLT